MSIDYSVLALPKGEPRKRAKGRKLRAEATQLAIVRAQCKTRDGYCRLGNPNFHRDKWHFEKGDALILGFGFDLWGRPCQGASQLCHMHERRRSKTRGMDPAVRHDARFCFIGCEYHHQEYDSKRLVITALTRKGADGPLRFMRAK